MKLKTSHGRKKTGLFLVESKKLLADAWYSERRIMTLVVEEGREDLIPALDHHLMDRFDVTMALDRMDIYVLPPNLFRELSYMDNPEGILAVAEWEEKEVDLRWEDKFLLLDHMQDPGNVGALLRSAEAFGFRTVLSLQSVDFTNEKVLRSSMGAVFRENLRSVTLRDISQLQNEGVALIGGDLHGIPLPEMQWPERFILVIGNEGNGISEEISNLLDARVTIPMRGYTESLNAAVSGSILMAHTVF